MYECCLVTSGTTSRTRRSLHWRLFRCSIFSFFWRECHSGYLRLIVCPSCSPRTPFQMTCSARSSSPRPSQRRCQSDVYTSPIKWEIITIKQKFTLHFLRKLLSRTKNAAQQIQFIFCQYQECYYLIGKNSWHRSNLVIRLWYKLVFLWSGSDFVLLLPLKTFFFFFGGLGGIPVSALTQKGQLILARGCLWKMNSISMRSE